MKNIKQLKTNLAKLKIFILILCLCTTYSKAQTYITIPDSQFVHYLYNTIPNAMNGNQMDITSPAVTTMTLMYVQGYTIRNLTGIQYFTSLIKLESSNGLPVLTYIPSFPASLQEIILPYCQHLKNLPALPLGLKILRVNTDSLLNLPTLPTTLISLICNNNYLTVLPALPPSINHLEFSGNLITQLSSLPQSLHYLMCTANYLTSLPTLPDSLLSLFCSINKITCFPPFPKSLTNHFTFDISQNPFTCLPNYVDAMDSITRAYPLCELGNPNGCEPAVPTVINIPNVFTPNGDNINDEFFIKATDIANFSCQIYNRWGLLIYQWNNINSGWNGKDKSGVACSEGTYYYMITYTDYTKKIVHKNSFFELLK